MGRPVQLRPPARTGGALLRLPGQLGDAPHRLEADARSLAFALRSATGTAKVAGGSAFYPDALPGCRSGTTRVNGVFTGTIHQVVIDVAPEAEHDHALTMSARYAKQ